MAGGTMSGSGTLGDPYQVEDAVDLKAIESYGYDKYYLQVSNFALGTFASIGHAAGTGYTAFTGEYDGNNFIISDGSITVTSGDAYNGIFARSTGTLKNMIIDNVDGDFSDYGGILAGWAEGTVSNITIKNGYVSYVGSGASVAHLGGVIGYVHQGIVDDIVLESMVLASTDTDSELGLIAGTLGTNGTIQNCSTDSSCSITANSTGSIGGIVGEAEVNTSIIQKCLNEATVSGGASVGGIVGRLDDGQALNCHNKGSVSIPTGTGTGAGGIAGRIADTGKVDYCLNEGNISGYSTVGGIAGATSASSRIIYSYALNSSITRTSGTSTLFGRIAGQTAGTFTSNYALDTMTMNT